MNGETDTDQGILFDAYSGTAPSTVATIDATDAYGTPVSIEDPYHYLGSANVVPTDADGLAFARDAAQVLSVVYLGSSEACGGFFPECVNTAPAPEPASSTAGRR